MLTYADACSRWEYTDKFAGGRGFQELDFLPDLRRFGAGGRLHLSEVLVKQVKQVKPPHL